MYETEDTPPASLSKNDGSAVGENRRLSQAVSVVAEAARQDHGSSDTGGDGDGGTRLKLMEFSIPNVVKTSKELKELGAKARTRLEEEKSKRPEIQILDQVPASNPEKSLSRRAASTFSAKVASQKPVTTTEAAWSRKRKLGLEQPRRAKKSGQTSNHPSSWEPDVSHIELPEVKSATVKLHGLPIHCTVEHVNRFFAGLNLQHISILLPNNTTIAELDASNSPPMKPTGVELSRLRVLAHFESVSAAILASERSGETILTHRGDRNTKKEEYIVAVTILSTKLASALSLVSISALPHQPFETTLEDITTMQEFHPLVPKILWSVVIRRLLHDSLPMDRSIEREEIILLDEDPLWCDYQQPGTGVWRSHQGYQRFAKHYNRLVDMQDELLHGFPYPMVEISSLRSQEHEGYRRDPVVHLTTEACKVLTNELDKMQGLLYRARVSYNLMSGLRHHFGSKK